MRHRHWRTLRRRMDGDAGFGLVEAIAAAFVLLLFSTGIAGLILSSLKVSKTDRQRVAASSLAAREMEIVRDQFARSDAAALEVVGQGLVVNPNRVGGGTGPSKIDGVEYTVSRVAAWAANGTGVSACDGGGSVNYPGVRLNVEVRWPDMGSVRPVTSSSLVTPNKTLLNTDYAFVAVKVNTFAAQASPGRTITATGPSGNVQQVTDGSGCAVFGLATPGNHTFTLSESGFVGYYGEPTPSVVRNVARGSFSSFAVTYDRAVTLQATYQTQSGHALPSPLPALVVRSSGLPSPGTKTFPTAGSLTLLRGLGPYLDGYTVWAGGCADAEPAGDPTRKTVTVVFPTAGSTLPVQVTLAPVRVTSQYANAQVVARHDGPCTLQPDLVLGTTDATGVLLTSLPYGAWQLTLQGVTRLVVPAAEGTTAVDFPVTP